MPGATMFRMKVCGLKNVANAVAVSEAGADALGLNFYAQSKRRVDLPTAARIADAVRGRSQLVGLFVNAPLEEIARTHQQVGFDWIQLHGDEPYRFAAELHAQTGLPILVACRGTLCRWRIPAEGTFAPHATLLDAAVPGAYGGTGYLTDWELAAQWRTSGETPHLVLAGGLTPQNVAEAITTVRPTAIDVAGGVEDQENPGVKNLAKVEAFIAAAQAAFAQAADGD